MLATTSQPLCADGGAQAEKKKGGQFNAFGRGGIIYLSKEGMRPSEIAKRVEKTNGKLGKVGSMRKTIRKFKRIRLNWKERRDDVGTKGACGWAAERLAERTRDRRMTLRTFNVSAFTTVCALLSTS